ncbi:MAG: hypothetical protein L0Y72_20620 [Gemmataceae bacterium]|nr:hypothetical protein [Gemmataceae bacterium]MCI0741444.1 hypothetical protein [Gemmataceae bacterium]
MHQGRWGYYPCSFDAFQKLKELNKLWEKAKRQRAAWQRWIRKLPHNRVSRPRLCDERGRTIGYGSPIPLPEPVLHPAFCRKVQLPSGRWDVELRDVGIESAYRLARHPKATPDAVVPLPVALEEVHRLYDEHCRE